MFKLIFLLLFGVPLFAQEARDSLGELKSTPDFPEVELVCFCSMEAQFPGGPRALESYIRERLVISNEVASSLNSSRVYVSFTVTDEGLIEEVKIERGMHPDIDQSILRVVKNMPRWIPYQLGCDYKSTRVQIPVFIDIY